MVTNTATKDGLKQTVDERVASSVSTQALLQSAKGTGSDVRIVRVRILTLFDFLPNPAVRLPQAYPRSYSTSSPRLTLKLAALLPLHDFNDPHAFKLRQPQ